MGTLWSEGRIPPFAFYATPLSSLYKFIGMHATYQILVRNSLSSVCLWLYWFSHLPFVQHMRLSAFSLSIPLLMIMRICVLCLIIIEPEVWIISHYYVGLGHTTMVHAIYLGMLPISQFAHFRTPEKHRIRIKLQITSKMTTKYKHSIMKHTYMLQEIYGTAGYDIHVW